MKKNAYKLHSSGDNWWHFRKNVGGIMESWTVTIVHDGTVVLTGDYGVLAFRREYFPKDIEILKYFPGRNKKSGIETGIDYFAEKICFYGNAFNITDWNVDRAQKDIKESLEYRIQEELENKSYGEDSTVEKLKNIRFDTEEEMYNILHDVFPDIEWGESTPGRDYTSLFKYQFELLKYWTTYLKENLGGK